MKPLPSFLLLVLLFSINVILALPPSFSDVTVTASQKIPSASHPFRHLHDYHTHTKRTATDLGNGWHMSIDNYETFIPLGISLADLVRFYNDLLSAGHAQATQNRPALSHFIVAYGALQMTFWSTDLIPWSWLIDFGEQLVGAVFCCLRVNGFKGNDLHSALLKGALTTCCIVRLHSPRLHGGLHDQVLAR